MAGLEQSVKELGAFPEAAQGKATTGLEEPNIEAAQPWEWSDVVNPKRATEKAIYGLARGAPAIGGAIVGGVGGGALGSVAAPGVGTAVGATAGTALGAAAVTTAQSLAPYLNEQLRTTPDDPDGAFDRALTQAGMSGAVSGAMMGAFKLAPFQGAVKNLLFQAFGVQPAIGTAGRVAQNVYAGREPTEGIGQEVVNAAVGTLGPAAAHMAVSRGLGAVTGRMAGDTATGAPRAPEAAEQAQAAQPTPPGTEVWYRTPEGDTGRGVVQGIEGGNVTVQDASGATVTRPVADAGLMAVEPETPPAGASAQNPLKPGDVIGVKFPKQPSRRASIESFFDNGESVRLRFDDGTARDYLTQDVLRDRTEPPPPFEQPEPDYGPQRGGALSEAESWDIMAEAEAMGRKTPSTPVGPLGGDVIAAMDRADALERAALDPGSPYSAERRNDMLAEAQALRRRFGTERQFFEPSPAERAAQDAEIRRRQEAAALGELGKVAPPEGYELIPPAIERPKPPMPLWETAELRPQENYGSPPPAFREPPRAPVEAAPEAPAASPVATEAPTPRSKRARVRGRPAPLPNRPLDLVEWLARNGGLAPHPDLTAMDADKKFVPGAGKLVRKATKAAVGQTSILGEKPTDGVRNSLDYARMAAAEAGYPVGDTEATFLDAIDNTLRGNKVYSDRDVGELADRAAAEEAARYSEEDAADLRMADLRERADALDVPYAPDWTEAELLAEIHEREAIMAEPDVAGVHADYAQQEHNRAVRKALPEVADEPGDPFDLAREIGPEPAPAPRAEAYGEGREPAAGEAPRGEDAGEVVGGNREAQGEGPVARAEPEAALEPVPGTVVDVGGVKVVRTRDPYEPWAVARWIERPAPGRWDPEPQRARTPEEAVAAYRAANERQAADLRAANDRRAAYNALVEKAKAGTITDEEARGFSPYNSYTLVTGDAEGLLRNMGLSLKDARKVMGAVGTERMTGNGAWLYNTWDIIRAAQRRLGIEARPEPRTERTDQGDQYVLPGAEQSARQAAAAREAEGRGRIRAPGEQKAADEGLFAPPEAPPEEPLFQRQHAVSDLVREKAPKLARRIERIATDMFPGLKTYGRQHVVDGRGRPVNGFYLNTKEVGHLAMWSLESPDAVGTIRHEGMHYLRRAGILTDKEWSTLTKAAEDGDWIAKHRIDRAYGDLPRDRILEEAIAQQFAEWRRTAPRSVTAPVRLIFQRIAAFLQRVAAATRAVLGRDITANDIFANIESGRIGRRGAANEAAEPAYQRTAARTDTPEFKRWFGDSKVVDKRGNPLVVYHGSPDVRGLREADARFLTLTERLAKQPDKDRAFFFTPDRRVAGSYADDRRAFDYQNAEPGLVPAHLSLQNPKIIDWEGNIWKGTREAIAEAKAQGHDGIIIKNVKDTYNTFGKKNTRVADVYVAFHPEQIKSIFNRGTFDPNDPRILYQRDTRPERPTIAPEGRDPVDEVSAALGAEMKDKGLGTYARALKEMGPLRADPKYKSLGAVERYTIMPRVLASLDTLSAAFWQAVKALHGESNTMLHDWRSALPTFLDLKAEGRQKVYAAEELARLGGRVLEDDGRRVVLRNEGEDWAWFSKPGESVRLSPDETRAFHERREMFRKVWQDMRRSVAARMGWDGEPTPEAVMEAVKNAAGSRRRELTSLADVLRGIEEREKTGYVPFMRFGDYFVVVKAKVGTVIDSLGGFPRVQWFGTVDSRPAFEKLFGSVRPQGYVPGAARDLIAELRQKFPADRFDIETGYLHAKPNILRELSIPAIEKLFMVMENGFQREMASKAKAGEITPENRAATDRLFHEMVDTFRNEMFEELKAGFKRKARDVPGYSKDFDRATGAYMHGAARNIADMIHRDDIERTYLDIQTNHTDPNVKTYWKNWRRYQEEPSNLFSRWADNAAHLGFYWTLAGNPSSMFVNLMDAPQMAAATLAAGIGEKGGLGAGRAYSEVFKALGHGIKAATVDAKRGLDIDLNRMARTPEERAFLQKLEAEGELHSRGSYDLGALRDAQTPLVGENAALWRRMLDIAASNMSATERVNRAAVALAALRLAKDPAVLARQAKAWGGNEVFKEMVARQRLTPETMARFLLSEAANEWGRMNRSPFQQNPAGRLAWQFRNYPQRYLSRLWNLSTRMGPAGKAAATLMLANLWLLGGVAGLPFVQDLEKAYDLTAQGADKYLFSGKGADPMSDARIRELLADAGFGKLGAELVMRGPASSMLGVDLSSRLGFGDLISRGAASPLDLVPVASIMWGALSGAAKRARSGQGAVASVAQALPAAIRNPVQAVGVYPEQGARSQTGKTIYVPPKDIDIGDVVKKAAGFTPEKLSRAYERSEYLYRAKRAKGPVPRNPYPRPTE